MQGVEDSPQARAAAAYDAASDRYDDEALSFWARIGARTVERLSLAPGARVLDVCCGSGASALPAARAVGRAGSVLGLDVSERLLALARAKARSEGLARATFARGDLLSLDAPVAGFDAVVCVFGLFFAPDMGKALRDLWACVAPGGVLAVTTWGRDLFEPANGIFWDALREERPELVRAYHPWDRIAEPESLRALFDAAGIPDATMQAEPARHPLRSPEDWWTIVLGSGYRGTTDALAAETRERVRRANLAALEARAVRDVCADALHATARKPGA